MTAAAGPGREDAVPRAAGRLSRLVDALRIRRDKLLTSNAFLDWALRFPLTRPVARARTRELFDLCAGFVYSQVLFACVRLRVFDHLAAAPDTIEGLAQRMNLSRDSTRSLLDAAAGIRLVERRGGRYGLGPLGAAVIAAPGVVQMIEHHSLLYADLTDPIALLRDRTTATRLGHYWPYATADVSARFNREGTERYTQLMAASQAMIAAEVIAAVPFGTYRSLLDIGGGDGSFLAAVARAAPAIQMTLFDLPPVADRAAIRFESAGLADRAAVFGGDFRCDPLPTGADIVTLIRVVHDHDDDTVLDLLRAIGAALPAGGAVVVAEPMLDLAGAESVGAYFAFYLLAMGRGRPRTAKEIAALLRAAGFERTRSIPTRSPVITGIVKGVRPRSVN